MTADKPKRITQPWYMIEPRPICPHCNVPCLKTSTPTSGDGLRIQYRRCPTPGCKYSIKTPYRPE